MAHFRKPLCLILPLLAAACNRPTQQAAAPPPSAPNADLPATISFNEHIQPILSEYCYHCHGPDSGTRAPKHDPLRLDRPADAFAPRKSGPAAIIAENPADSPVMQRIHATAPDEIMPPPSSHKTLAARDIALLERWIAQGAVYENHWSLNPPQRPTPPAAGAKWSTHPVDSFIAAGLDAAGLAPNPPEDPRRFFRRLHFDLTGLPPSPEAVENFARAAATDDRQAVASAADELMASPAAAEHQARIWLDAARYADTHGIHIDNYRAIWPYRDWVVRAFEQNMPWDRFTIEQIAGDLLPDPTLDQLVATGFNRCLPTTGEGGAIPEEYDAIYAKDRVDTVSTVWLGLTVGCASCHDHKFDPISTREFYSLSAFFRNTTMKAMDENRADHPPNIFVPLPVDRERWNALASTRQRLENAKKSRATAATTDFTKWLASARSALPDLATALALHLPLNESEGPVHGTADGKSLVWDSPVKRADGLLEKSLLAHSAAFELGDHTAFARGDRISFGAFVRVEGAPNGPVVSRMDAAQGFRGWDLWLENGRIGSHIIDQWPAAANKILTNEPLAPGRWHHVMVVFDGTRPAAETMTLYLDGRAVPHQTVSATLGDNPTAAAPLLIGRRHHDPAVLNGQVAIQDFRFYRRALTPDEIAALGEHEGIRQLVAIPDAQHTPAQRELIKTLYQKHLDPATRELNSQLAALANDEQEMRARGSLSLIMAERKDSKPRAHILARGVYTAKGDEVPADVPALLPPLPEGAPRDRLSLARWLTDRANPLPARVTANRFWLQCFGTGLVETAEDFGITGARPSHPQLLDWLAVEFMDSGWNPRHILKLIVTSATYRQSTAISPEKLDRDPLNRLLSRGPRHRLDAEALRDLALTTSGLLNPARGGPPVKPYQPTGIWEAVAMKESNTRHYKEDSGPALYRRSLYTFWKRTAPPPSMEILNAPARETTCVRRERTNTPLQALVTLNDPQYLEAARELAAAAIKAAPSFDARLDHLTSRLIARPLAPEERATVRRSLDVFLTDFTNRPKDAAALTTTGAKPPPGEIPPPELAAWTLVASQLFNLDETLTH